jgi:hypothetical protein
MGDRCFRIARALGVAAVALGASSAAAADGQCPEATPGVVDDACVPTRPAGVALIPDLSVLKSPETPAFAALDLAPTAITRPGTPTGAAVELASGIVHGVMNPGQNVAIDVSPYWLVSHPTVTAKQIADQPSRAFYRRFSLSFATAEGKVKLADTSGQLVDTSVGRVAFGARTSLLPGEASEAAKKCGEYVDTFVKHSTEAVATAQAVFVAAWKSKNPTPTPPPRPTDGDLDPPKPTDARFRPTAPSDEARAEARAKFDEANRKWNERMEAIEANKTYLIELDAWARRLDEAIATWRKSLDETPSADVLACLDVMHHREGLMLDIAAAEVLNFPADDIKRLSAAGGHSTLLWATGGYTLTWGTTRPGGGYAYDLSFLGLAKITWDHVARVPDTRGMQLGARAVLAVQKFGFSVEGLRTAADGVGAPPTTYRVAAGVDYHLKSGIWLTITGGAELDDKGKPTEPLALANFQANFGHERLITPDTTVSRPSGSSP